MFKEGRSFLLPLALGASMFSIGMIVPAHADPYSFTFQGTGILGTLGSVTINGVLTTTGTPDSTNSLNSPPGFDITGITGTYDAFTIQGLVQPSTCTPASVCSALNTLNPPAEYVFYYPGSPTYLDTNGFVFADTIGDLVNLWSDGTDFFASNCAASASCTAFADAAQFEGSFTITPLPGSLPLLATILVPGYFISAWRRRRKHRSATVPI